MKLGEQIKTKNETASPTMWSVNLEVMLMGCSVVVNGEIKQAATRGQLNSKLS